MHLLGQAVCKRLKFFCLFFVVVVFFFLRLAVGCFWQKTSDMNASLYTCAIGIEKKLPCFFSQPVSSSPIKERSCTSYCSFTTSFYLSSETSTLLWLIPHLSMPPWPPVMWMFFFIPLPSNISPLTHLTSVSASKTTTMGETFPPHGRIQLFENLPSKEILISIFNLPPLQKKISFSHTVFAKAAATLDPLGELHIFSVPHLFIYIAIIWAVRLVSCSLFTERRPSGFPYFDLSAVLPMHHLCGCSYCDRWPGESSRGPDRGVLRHSAVPAGPSKVQAAADEDTAAAGRGVQSTPQQGGRAGGADQPACLQDANHWDQEQQAQVCHFGVYFMQDRCWAV